MPRKAATTNTKQKPPATKSKSFVFQTSEIIQRTYKSYLSILNHDGDTHSQRNAKVKLLRYKSVFLSPLVTIKKNSQTSKSLKLVSRVELDQDIMIEAKHFRLYRYLLKRMRARKCLAIARFSTGLELPFILYLFWCRLFRSLILSS